MHLRVGLRTYKHGAYCYSNEWS